MAQKFFTQVAFIVLIVAGTVAFAAEEYYPFDTDEQRERFLRFTHELRCPKCQGQTLAGSDAGVAEDLKRELHRLIVAGKNDREIIDFMVSRYGDFVLYNPPVQPNTYALWFGPVVIFIIGLIVFIRIVRNKPEQQIEKE